MRSPATPTLSPAKREAPILFKRRGWYYLLYGHTCCFCKGAAGAHVMVSRNPLANWTNTGYDINPLSGTDKHVVPSQNNYVFLARLVGNTTAYSVVRACSNRRSLELRGMLRGGRPEEP